MNIDEALNLLSVRFRAFFQNPWFRRIWTLQEAVLGYELFFSAGETQATHTQLLGLLALFLRLDDSTSGAAHNLWNEFASSLFSLRRYTTGEWEHSTKSFTPLLQRSASDDRDYVYGQLGLFHPHAMDLLEPDYSAKIEDVFIAGTMAFLQSSKKLNALDGCCRYYEHGRYCLLLPSWCRDWSESRFGCGVGMDISFHIPFTAATRYHCGIKYEPAGNI